MGYTLAEMTALNWFFVLWIFGIAVWVAEGLSADRRRDGKMRAFAAGMGFRYLDTTLPESLTLQGTGLEQVRTWNVMEGNRSGLWITVFDCQSSRGRATWRCTAIAVHAGAETLNSASRFDIGTTVERSGDWAILYQRSAGLMPPDDIEAYMTSIGT